MRRIVLVLGFVSACSSSSESKSEAVVAKADAKDDAKAGAKRVEPKPAVEREDGRAGETPESNKAEKAVSGPVQPIAVDPPEPSSKPVEPTSVAPDAMLDDLLDGKVVAFAPKDGSVAYAVSGSVEGTGSLLSLVVQTADGKRDDLEICAGDPECETTSKSKPKRDEMIAKLKSREWITLPRVEWPEGKDELVANGFTITWKQQQLGGKLPDGSALVFPKVPEEAPHKPSPSAAYVSAEHRIAAVDIAFDPGEGYGEGFNVFTDTFVGRAK
ncbi:MAG TPA: hypothetical protein VG755_11085 [Nannocystaceae bacterium]|nr:hypothetical protein [Nannocystaceae bacterium]